MKKAYLSILLLGLYLNAFSADITTTVCYVGFASTKDNPTINGLMKKANEVLIDDLAMSGTISIVNLSNNKIKADAIDSLSGYQYLVYGSIESSGDTYTIKLISKNTTDMTLSTHSRTTDNVLDVFSICDDLFEEMAPSIAAHTVVSKKQDDDGDYAPTIDSITSAKIHEWLFNGNPNDGVTNAFPWKGKLKYVNDRKNNPLAAIDCNSNTILQQEAKYDLYNDFTISVWVSLTKDSALAYGRLYDCMQYNLKTGYNILYLPNIHAFSFSYFDEKGVSRGVKTNEAVHPNIWYNVIVTFKDGVSCLYLDGKLQEMNASNHTIAKSQRYISIGNGFDDGNNQPLYGKIDDVLIFSRALTSQEVSVLYQTF